MSIHSLPLEDRISYLKSIVTNMQLLHRAGAYSSIELGFKQFDDLWGGPQNNQQLDELTARIACLYYLSLYQLLLLRNDIDITVGLSQLKTAIEMDKYIKQVNRVLTDSPATSTAGAILDLSTNAANSINTLLDLVKKKNLELTIGALINDCLQQIDHSIEYINQDNFAEHQNNILTIMSRLSISFDKQTEINHDIEAHSLFSTLYAKLASVYVRSLAFEMRAKDSIAEKYTVFEHLGRVKQAVMLHDSTTEIVNTELNQAYKQLQKDIDVELEQLALMDYSNCTEETACLMEKRLQSILLATFDEDGLYGEEESAKRGRFFLACYNETKRLLAANSQNIKVIEVTVNLYKLLQFFHHKTAITSPSTEELEQLGLKIDCEELLCTRDHDDFLSRIESVKSRLKAKRISLVGDIPLVDDEQLKSHWVSAASKLNHEQQHLLVLINYYFAFYYHLMIGHYQGLDKRRERTILVSKAILHYETAQSIRATYLEELEGAAYGDVALLSSCQKNYQDHCTYSLPHLIKFLTTEIAKADELFVKKDFANAAPLYMACWEFLNSHPVLIVNNSVIQPKQILLNAARTYRLVSEYSKAWSCYALLLKSPDLLSLSELFEIRAFLSEHLKSLFLDINDRCVLENMYYMISERIGNSVAQLKQMVLHGPREWQGQAYSELMTTFSKNKELYHVFVHEVASLYQSHIRQYEELKETTPIKLFLKENFHCYGQVLYDIAANINSKKLKLHEDFNSAAILDSFFLMAVERGCGSACYDYAIKKFNQGEYLDAYRKFTLAVLDMSWNNADKKKDAHDKIRQAQLELRKRHQDNPLRLINEMDRTPEYVSFYDEMEQLLKNQVPEVSQTPMSPAPEMLSPKAREIDKGEDDMIHDSESRPKGILKKRSSTKKRHFDVAFQSGNNLTLFAPVNAPSYDRRPTISPQLLRQRELIRQGKRSVGATLTGVDEVGVSDSRTPSKK